MSDSNKKGGEFEERVKQLFSALAASYPKLVKLERPTITLQNDETVKPDFHLIVEFAHERRNYLFECQDRQKTSKDIHHKIQHIRNKHWMKTFIFLYPDSLAEEPKRAMEAEGIMHMNFSDLELWVRRVSASLAVQPEIEPDRGKAIAPMVIPFLSSNIPRPSRMSKPLRQFFRIIGRVLMLVGLLAAIDFAFPLLAPRSGLGANALMIYYSAKDAVSDLVSSITHSRTEPEKFTRRRMERAKRNIEFGIYGALSELKMNIGEMTWKGNGTDADTKLVVLIPSTGDLTLFMSQISQPAREENDLELMGNSEEELKKVVLKTGQTAIAASPTSYWIGKLNRTDSLLALGREQPAGTEGHCLLPSEEEFINFCKNAAKSLSEFESIQIRSAYRSGDTSIFLCALKSSSAQPVEILFHTTHLEIPFLDSANRIKSRFELIMPSSAWDIEAARNRTESSRVIAK